MATALLFWWWHYGERTDDVYLNRGFDTDAVQRYF